MSTPDPNLLSLLSQIFVEDPYVCIETLSLEAGVLDECIEKRPDLLVIDGVLPGQTWAEIIHSLREIEELKNLRIPCLAEPQQVRRYLTWGVDDVWPKGPMEKKRSEGTPVLALENPEGDCRNRRIL